VLSTREEAKEGEREPLSMTHNNSQSSRDTSRITFAPDIAFARESSLLVDWILRGVFGRDAGIRTRDPLNPIQVRYQTAPRPDRDGALKQGKGRGVKPAARRLLLSAAVQDPNDLFELLDHA
jgi:hypothetical protein